MTPWRDLKSMFLTLPDLAALPPRVREAIRRRERANELLTRIIQLSIIAIFCLIYAASPKTSPDGAFAPVPYVLATYLVLSVVGLAWVLLRDPPDWSEYGSIVFDFALLYALMVSFHIQYMQPASFVLKAPSLLYVFIFIAVRALRFHPKYVVAAGLAAAVGWAAMILYVVRIDPGDNMLTRSYVEYLTSNSILIGAEIDKILSILFVTAILAVAVNGSNNMLVRAVAEQSAADELSRFFDRGVAHGIRAGATPLAAGEGVRVEAAVLSVDIRGFTAIASSLEASEVMRLLSAYQSAMVPVIRSHGGTIDKFMGDGILASFGTAPGEGAPEASALSAAEELLRAAERMNADPALAAHAPLRIGIGLASGPVSWGAVGLDDRLEMTVIGPAVNLSARLEKQNKLLGTVLACHRETWLRALEQGFAPAFAYAEQVTIVEGLPQPVEIVSVAALAPASPAQVRAMM